MKESTIRSRMWRLRTPLAASAVLLVGLLGVVTVACGPSMGMASAPSLVSAAPPPAVKLTPQPGVGATGVTPGQPASITAADGELQQVGLANADGKPVAGEMGPDRHSWRTTEPLGYGKTYTWTGTATGRAGAVPITGSFSTVAPDNLVHAQFGLADGQTVGVAAPIILTFDGPVADKAAVERALTVRTSVPTEGSWAWLPDDNGGSRVHWRPKDYWKPGTQVTVSAKLYGLAMGNGTYGNEDVGNTFTVGRPQIVKGDVNSFRMVVVRDGQQVMDIPASYGLGSDPTRNTRNGTHVVMSKTTDVLMSNPRYGYNNVPEKWAVRISNNGEFIHANPASTGSQGEENVTHGCVNLSTVNAKNYFDTALFGDPVEITGSPIPLAAEDGDIYDWAMSWDQWRGLSALAGR